jgi:hypothetical protein
VGHENRKHWPPLLQFLQVSFAQGCIVFGVSIHNEEVAGVVGYRRQLCLMESMRIVRGSRFFLSLLAQGFGDHPRNHSDCLLKERSKEGRCCLQLQRCNGAVACGETFWIQEMQIGTNKVLPFRVMATSDSPSPGPSDSNHPHHRWEQLLTERSVRGSGSSLIEGWWVPNSRQRRRTVKR